MSITPTGSVVIALVLAISIFAIARGQLNRRITTSG